jgi:integrase
VNFSATVCLRTPAQKNGLNTVRLQVILNRKVMPLALGIAWPELLWDKDVGQCLAKLPAGQRTALNQAEVRTFEAALGGDVAKKAADYNLIIGQALAKVNEIAVRYRLSNQHLTADEFLREYNTGASREDFLKFMESRIAERYRRGQITELTRKSHQSTLNKLSEYVSYSRRVTLGLPRRKTLATEGTEYQPLPFCNLNHRLSTDFDAWLTKEHGSCTNTRARRHRTVKAYLELARRDKITFENPYEYFSNPTVDGKWFPLSAEELAMLEAHYLTLEPGSAPRRILQKFLFSCNCGLRLGDLKAMADVRVEGQVIFLKPQKTYRYNEKTLQLPITRKALSYLEDSRQENDCAGFHLYTDQYTNRMLKSIGARLGIQTGLHHHIGRETFATNFIRKGGKVEVLQKLMGHSKLAMTMKYVHVDEAMKRAEIDRLDALE